MRSDAVKTGMQQAPHRPLFNVLGMTEEEMRKPLVGTASSYSEVTPGHMNLDKIVDVVELGAAMVGDTPVAFPVIAVCDGIAMGHIGVKYSLMTEDLIADSTERMALAHQFGVLVMAPNCDKNVPGLLMATAKINASTVFVSGGPMLAGHMKEYKINLSGTLGAVGAYAVGNMSEEGVEEFKNKTRPTCGSCSGMYTVNSMNCLTEVLGIGPRGNDITPAVYSKRIKLAKHAGVKVMEMYEKNIRPRDIMTKETFMNALTMDMTLRCSTNGMLHLPAIAHGAGMELNVDITSRISTRIPNLCHLAPAGPTYIGDLNEIGGIYVVVKEIGKKELLNPDCTVVMGRTVGENIKDCIDKNPEVIRPVENLCSQIGGIAILKGNLAPNPAVARRPVVVSEMLKHEGPARVFGYEEDAIDATKGGRIVARDAMATRYEGPKGSPGMKEILNPISAIVGMGLGSTVILIADGCFSGASRGVSIDHASPEAVAGGPIALAEEKDIISIDIDSHKLNALASDEEVVARKAKWWPRMPQVTTGCLARYMSLVISVERRAMLQVKQALGSADIARPSGSSGKGRASWNNMGKRSVDMSKLTGTEIVVAYLREQGVDTVSGYPSGVILNIYDTLCQHRDEITHILTSREQGASHATDGYARVTGEAGMCLATPGPGATDLVTGITTVYMDSMLVVAITCNMANSLLGKDSSQEINATGVITSITKYNFIVKDVSRLATVIRRAFIIAQTERPGPVLVDITKGMTVALCEYERQVPEEIVRQSDTVTEQSMDRAVEMTRKAAKPFIFVDGGTVLSNVSNELRAFAHKIQAPVADSLMGKGAFDGTDELYTGMVSMHGTKISNFGITEANLLIVVRTRLSDHMTDSASKFAKNAKTFQLDIDPAEINKDARVDASIVGDVKAILREFSARLDPVNHGEWIAHIGRMRDVYLLYCGKNVLTGPFTVQAINEVTGGDTVIITEMGRHQMWAAQYYQYRQSHTLLTSGGLGITRYGLGATIGAKMGCGDKTVTNTADDDCFRINMNETATVTRYNIPVAEVIVNSHVLDMVRQWQTPFHGRRYSQAVSDGSMDFVKIAEAMGTKACRVTQKKKLELVPREAISLNIPVVIDCQISCNDKVFPMVSPGAPIAGAFDDTDLKTN